MLEIKNCYIILEYVPSASSVESELSEMINLESQKIARLLEIIERNKWEILRHQTEVEEQEEILEHTQSEDVAAQDVKMVLYAAPSSLTDSLVAMLSHETVVSAFDDPERLISFCNKYHILFVMMDLDPPTDSHLAFDVFSALRIINPDITFFACTKRINSKEKEYLIRNGVIILEKPILRKQIDWIMQKVNRK